MDFDDEPPLNATLQTKMTVFPKTVKEIGNLIKRAESLLDDLSIDLAAAETQGDGDGIARLQGRRDVVHENLEALQQLRDSRKRRRAVPPHLPAKRTRSAAAQSSTEPTPAQSFAEPIPAPPKKKARPAAKKGRKPSEAEDEVFVEPMKIPILQDPTEPGPPPSVNSSEAPIAQDDDEMAPPSTVESPPPVDSTEAPATIVDSSEAPTPQDDGDDEMDAPSTAESPPPIDSTEVPTTIVNILEAPTTTTTVISSEDIVDLTNSSPAGSDVEEITQTFGGKVVETFQKVKQEPEVPNPADLEGLFSMKEEDKEKDGASEAEDDREDVEPPPNPVPAATSSGSGHFPDIYGNLSQAQRDAIHEEAACDFEQFLRLNIPLSHTSRTWGRRGQPVLAQAAFHSKMLAASCLILNTGVTKCPYHFNSTLSKKYDLDPTSHGKVTGVPFKPNKAKKGRVANNLLDRPNRTDSMGRTKPPRPNSYNPNFTLEKVLQFFFVSDDGVHYLHCGCALDEVLLEFAFWKRTTLVSPSTGARNPAPPMKPRDRAILCAVLNQLNITLDLIYEYDDKGRRRSNDDRSLMWMDRISGALRGGGGGKIRAESSAGPSRRSLKYVEIADEEEEGRSRKGAGNDGRSRRGVVDDDRRSRRGAVDDDGRYRRGVVDDDGRSRRGVVDDDGRSRRGVVDDDGRSRRGFGDDSRRGAVDDGRSRRDVGDDSKSRRGAVDDGRSRGDDSKSRRGVVDDDGRSRRGFGDDSRRGAVDGSRSRRGAVDDGRSRRDVGDDARYRRDAGGDGDARYRRDAGGDGDARYRRDAGGDARSQKNDAVAYRSKSKDKRRDKGKGKARARDSDSDDAKDHDIDPRYLYSNSDSDSDTSHPVLSPRLLKRRVPRSAFDDE